MVDFYFEFDAFNQVIEINLISTVIYIPRGKSFDK